MIRGSFARLPLAVAAIAVIGLLGACTSSTGSAKTASTQTPVSSHRGGVDAAVHCGSGQRAIAAQVCAAEDDSRGREVLDTVRILQKKYSSKAVAFGVWKGDKELVSGAVGTSYPGVPATRDSHFRIGNVTEAMDLTLLLKLVEEHKISLNDRVSKWLPAVPHADKVTVEQLAYSTAGYASFYTDRFVDEFHADPFRTWTVDEMIAIGADQPLDFPPGSTWKFSDTNFTILGKVLEKAGGAPVSTQLQKAIFDPLRMHATRMTSSSYIPSPVLHGYDPERGDYQDSTFWSISWASDIADTYSTVHDLGIWARALGTGSLLSAASHKRQFAPRTVGLGPFSSTKLYAALGSRVVNGWIVSNPNVPGYWGTTAYLPSKKLTIVVFVTANPDAPQGLHYAVADFDQIAAQLAPDNAPRLAPK